MAWYWIVLERWPILEDAVLRKSISGDQSNAWIVIMWGKVHNQTIKRSGTSFLPQSLHHHDVQNLPLKILLLDRLKIQVCQEIENSIKFIFHPQKPVTYYWAGEKLKEEIRKLVNLQFCINIEELVEATRGKAKPVRVSKCHMYQIWHLMASSSQSSSPPSSSPLSKSQTSMVNETDKPADK